MTPEVISNEVHQRLTAIIERTKKAEKAYFMTALMNGHDFSMLSQMQCWSNKQEFVAYCTEYTHFSQDYVYKSMRLSQTIQQIVEERPALQSYGVKKGFDCLPYLEPLQIEEKCAALEATKDLSVTDAKKYFQEMKGEVIEPPCICETYEEKVIKVCVKCGKEEKAKAQIGEGQVTRRVYKINKRGNKENMGQ